MIDLKSKLVLSILAKECPDGSYKIIEIPDIIMAIPRRYRMDSDAVKNILVHLERQELVSVKYDDDDVFCLAVLPYGYEVLENERPKNFRKIKEKQPKINFLTVFLCFLASFLGSFLSSLICWLLLK